MKILEVVHGFPPRGMAGAEIYTASISQELAKLGHDVSVFAAVKDIAHRDLELLRREEGGVKIFEVVNNLYFDSFREIYACPRIEAVFLRALDEVQPDVVHFQHLLNLSLGCVKLAARRRVPVFFTLHDFWLQCARFGQRIRWDAEICHLIDLDTCARCMATLKFAQTSAERRVGRWVAGLRRATGVDLSGPAQRVGQRMRARGDEPDSAEPDPALVAARHVDLFERDRILRDEVVPDVTRFLAPSTFLRDRMVEWGIPIERIVHHRTGIDLAPFEGFERVHSGVFRVSFVGTIVPHKGVHVLLDAWELLDAETKQKAELRIHGSLRYRPDYVAKITRRCEEVGAILVGEVLHEEIARVHANTDLVVVPSVWYENSPLVIWESFATGTPVLVSDLGGMKELVRDESHGSRFPTGSAPDLARALAARIAQNTSGATPPSAPPAVLSLREDAESLVALYSAEPE